MSAKSTKTSAEEVVQPAAEEEREAGLKNLISMISDEQAEGILSLYNPNILRKVFGDGELMRTADCFLRNSLNISAAARNIYMHRNTMMYRLDKIERLTGLDIRTFDDALTFDILHKLYERKLRSGK
ncbi:MAG: helix-turn-helix domain-containing protein [Clostridia bacterium]|nr:helix-turn-helix domain-containing protein [Clostridia bacterium]